MSPTSAGFFHRSAQCLTALSRNQSSKCRPETPEAGLEKVSLAWGKRWQPQGREGWEGEQGQPAAVRGSQLVRVTGEEAFSTGF